MTEDERQRTTAWRDRFRRMVTAYDKELAAKPDSLLLRALRDGHASMADDLDQQLKETSCDDRSAL